MQSWPRGASFGIVLVAACPALQVFRLPRPFDLAPGKERTPWHLLKSRNPRVSIYAAIRPRYAD